MNWRSKLMVVVAVALILSTTAFATVYSGNLYYTTYVGGQNVWRVSFNYDQTTQALTLGPQINIASTPGADGIIFAPNGHLLVGGQGAGQVYEVDPSNGSFFGAAPGSTGQNQSSYHLALDPSGTKFYTSDFMGPLDTVPLPLAQGSTTFVTGGDTGITQVAFAPNGNVFYVNGNPNGFGNLGLINLTTGVTNRLYTSVTPAHGLIYDPFTGLMTFFGDGETGTMDQFGNNLMTGGPFTCDFDQGAVDGFGHALVAGCNSLTFLDYSISHDITHPDKVVVTGGFNFIDDVAPLVGPGSNVPEPSSLLLLGSGVAGLAGMLKRKLKA